MSHRDPAAVEMCVGGLVVDPDTKTPILILRGTEDSRLFLPIFIGGHEAAAIATVLGDVDLPRPMTHDLMASMLAEMSVTVPRVVITDVQDGTFYAEITLVDAHGHTWSLDARPSDSIALAVRASARIYVHPQVLEEAGGMDDADDVVEEAALPPADGSAAVIAVDTRLEDLEPETFGKYKM
jgi:bifunctional DNase/RNase